MKKLALLLIAFLILPTILAVNLNVEKISSNEVLIKGIKSPAIFNIKITNTGSTDSFQFYNLAGFEMFPKGTVTINAGQTKEVEIKITRIGEFPKSQFYTFPYYIRGQDGSETEEQLTVELIELKDAFEIGSGDINPESNTLEIYIHNKKNFNFEKINVKFNSAFFSKEEEFSLEPNQRKDFSIQLNKEDFKKLMAGFYTLKAEVQVEDEKANIEDSIKFVEKNILTTTKKDFGFVISTKIITKTNEGNVLKKTETVVKKNIISRLFTSFTPEPDFVERQKLTIYYTWSREIKPGESLEILVKTNWLFPFLIILFIVIIVISLKIYSTTNLVLRKKVSFVRTKGGEFALKISLLVHARKYIETISIIDRLPALVKIHEKFGTEIPKRVDEKTRRIEWNFEKLEAGETRLLSYIIYSKVGVLGKFALPSAIGIYEREGKIKEVESNKAFFISEQKVGDVEDEY